MTDFPVASCSVTVLGRETKECVSVSGIHVCKYSESGKEEVENNPFLIRQQMLRGVRYDFVSY